MNQETINAAAKEYQATSYNYMSTTEEREYCAFLADAAFAQDGGMRWVKFVDIKPEKEGEYFGRDEGSDSRCIWYYHPIRSKHFTDTFEWLMNESPNINQGGEKTL